MLFWAFPWISQIALKTRVNPDVVKSHPNLAPCHCHLITTPATSASVADKSSSVASPFPQTRLFPPLAQQCTPAGSEAKTCNLLSSAARLLQRPSVGQALMKSIDWHHDRYWWPYYSSHQWRFKTCPIQTPCLQTWDSRESLLDIRVKEPMTHSQLNPKTSRNILNCSLVHKQKQ